MQPGRSGTHEPSSWVASAAKLYAVGSVHPATRSVHEPSSTVALGSKLSALGRMQPCVREVCNSQHTVSSVGGRGGRPGCATRCLGGVRRVCGAPMGAAGSSGIGARRAAKKKRGSACVGRTAVRGGAATARGRVLMRASAAGGLTGTAPTDA
eukprot:571917-Prymnesium_polylepis.1